MGQSMRPITLHICREKLGLEFIGLQHSLQKSWIFTAEMSDKEAAPEASLSCLIAAIFFPKAGVRDT